MVMCWAVGGWRLCGIDEVGRRAVSDEFNAKLAEFGRPVRVFPCQINQVNLDISDFPAGVYFVQLKGESGVDYAQARLVKL